MHAKHYLGIGLMLVSLTVVYELFSQKRNQQLIEAVSSAVSEQLDQERVRRDQEDARLKVALIKETKAVASTAVSEQFREEQALRDANTKQLRSEGMVGALLSEGFVLASSTKMRVIHYYQEHGELPSSNHELDLPPSDQITGNAVRSLDVSWGGVITIAYNEKLGVTDGEVVLRPVTNPAFGIHWECESRSVKLIEKLIPQCRYTG